MPDRSPTPRPSWRTAALGAVGGLMVLLPLGEVVRHQTQDLQVLASERALLDPLSQAVAVQRGLLSHSDLCQRLLAGRLQLEPERKLRQALVDTALWDLQNTLSAGLWGRALGEAGQLTQDWRNLTQRIQARAVDGRTSQADHRLLIEQTLQVMDLVSAAAPSTASPHLLAWRQTGRFTAPSDSESAGAHALALAQVQDHLQAHSNALDERISRLLALRAWVGTAMAGLCLLLAAALLRRQTRGTQPQPPSTHDGVRMGQGRRATDADRAPDATSRLMWHLRQGPSRSATTYSDTLPPAP